MRIFVTGATGLLGNNLVRQLRAAGHDVIGLVRSKERGERLLEGTGVRLVVGDVRSAEAFAHELEGCDWVFHTAAFFRDYYAPGDHQQILEDTNIKATLTLLSIADRAGVRAFVHTGSSGTIGPGKDGAPGDEDSPPPSFASENLYFKSKVDGDAKIRAFTPRARAHGSMKVIEILHGWMWGPGDAGPTGAGRVALDFLGRKLPVVPPGGATVVDARDVAAAMIVAAERAPHGARYCVAGRSLTLGQMIEALEKTSGVPAPRVRVPYWLAMLVATLSDWMSALTGKAGTITRMGIRTMNAHHAISSARAQRELGATFRPFEETARDVVSWYRAHPVP